MVIETARDSGQKIARLGRDGGEASLRQAVDGIARSVTHRRAAAINAWLVASLAFWAVADFLISGSADGFVSTLPFMVLFGTMAFRLRGEIADRGRLLRFSGLFAFGLAGACGASLAASLLASPVDVACAVWSGGMVAGFGYAAWYQLRKPDISSVG
ncbi:MAG TPA: hypothetical protein VG845_00060 [Dehalococcoidia bacterium]|jgi:hypothetical protein|nr:hypothetical protein [Dehalococcoidia bacterium]